VGYTGIRGIVGDKTITCITTISSGGSGDIYEVTFATIAEPNFSQIKSETKEYGLVFSALGFWRRPIIKNFARKIIRTEHVPRAEIENEA
jgi:hypothetical protein